MKNAIIVVTLIILSGCATSAKNSSNSLTSSGEGAQKPTQSQIMDACMKVEVPLAIKGSAEKAALSPEEAQVYSDYICKVMSGICGENPNASGCPANLKRVMITSGV